MSKYSQSIAELWSQQCLVILVAAWVVIEQQYAERVQQHVTDKGQLLAL